MAFASIWTLLMLATTFGDYFSLFSDLRNGRCQVVEGPVQQFIPMRADGHGEESFVVAGHPFRYSDNVITAGFNQSASHGGPIREGLPVRIHYRRDEIAKLEIASPPP